MLVTRDKDHVVVHGDQVTLTFELAIARRIGEAARSADDAPPAGSGRIILPDDHLFWQHASGGSREDPRRRWREGDEPRAAEAHDLFRRPARQILSHLCAEPGALYSTDELCEVIGVTGDTRRNVLAASLHGFTKGCESVERVFPFTWWKDKAHGGGSLYGTRPSVAAIFRSAVGL